MGKNSNKKQKKSNVGQKRAIQHMSLQEMVDEVGPLPNVTYYMSTQALATRDIDDATLNAVSERQRAEIVTDRVAFIMLALDARLQELDNTPQEEIKKRSELFQFIQNAKKLLEGINKDIYYYADENEAGPRKVVHLNAKKLVKGEGSTSTKKPNLQRLEMIEEEMKKAGVDLSILLGNVNSLHIFYPPICKPEIGRMIDNLVNVQINNNPIIRELTEQYEEAPTIEELGKNKKANDDMELYAQQYREIMIDIIKRNSEEIDIDSLMLLIMQTNINFLDRGLGSPSEIKNIESALKILLEKIPQNAKLKLKIPSQEGEEQVLSYSYEELQQDFSRFYQGYYLTKRELPILKQSVLDGNIDVSRIDSRNIRILNLTDVEVLIARNSNYSNFAIMMCGKDYLSEETINGLLEIVSDEEIEWLYTKLGFSLEKVKNRRDLMIKLLQDDNLKPKDILFLYQVGTITDKDLIDKVSALPTEEDKYVYIYGNFSDKPYETIFNHLIDQIAAQKDANTATGLGPARGIGPGVTAKRNPMPSQLRWKLLGSLDPNFQFESLPDGHVAFIFPTYDKVIVEKMREIVDGKKCDAYGKTTHGMTIDEYNKYKHTFVQTDPKHPNQTVFIRPNIVALGKRKLITSIDHYPTTWGRKVVEFVYQYPVPQIQDQEKQVELQSLIKELEEEMLKVKTQKEKE